MDCIFCKIAHKEIPTEFLYEDEQVVAFRDLNPTAPVHVLIIPKKHIASLLELQGDASVAGHIMGEVIPELVKQLDIEESGFRVVVNTGKEGGQTVPHLHFHLLGGRDMQWPPG